MRGMEGLHLICIILKFKRVFPELLKLVEFLKINKFLVELTPPLTPPPILPPPSEQT